MGRGGRGFGIRQGDVGTLTHMSPNPVVACPTGSIPKGIYIPPDGKNLYAGSTSGAGTTQVLQFSRSLENFSIAPMAPAGIDANYAPGFVTGDSTNLHVYSSNNGGDKVWCFLRAVSGGALSNLPTQTNIVCGPGPWCLYMSPDNKFLYVACKSPGTRGSIYVYSRHLMTGVLTFVEQVFTGAVATEDRPHGIVMSPNGAYLYVACGNTNVIKQYAVHATAGTLTELATVSIASPNFPSFLVCAAHATGWNVYVANDSSPISIGCFTAPSGTGQLAAMGTATVPGGSGPWGLSVHPAGTALICASSDGQTVYQYGRSTTDGALITRVPAFVRSDPTIAAITGSGGPQNVLFGPEGKSAYCTNSTPASTVSQFHVKQ